MDRLPQRLLPLPAARRLDPRIEAADILPTDLAVRILYALGGPCTGPGREFEWGPGGSSSDTLRR